MKGQIKRNGGFDAAGDYSKIGQQEGVITWPVAQGWPVPPQPDRETRGGIHLPAEKDFLLHFFID
ncbi:hypothetical protein [Niabella soli]|uniref:Uncharacterized protein n=1 Tax=Niabella soli DSM 19437 TaxID=929713 RepID=W0F812_9BACT|nr:hypothetical protein [Niabella soli]AHF17953.1 hypothetical protein NIASO_17510 [Niabella soli DSM 19437]